MKPTNEANKNKNKTARDKTHTQGNNGNNSKRKVVVTGDSMLNGFNERGLSKHQNVKIQNFPGGTSETILDKVETLVGEKPDCIIIHAGTNDIMNRMNSLNSVKKIQGSLSKYKDSLFQFNYYERQKRS